MSCTGHLSSIRDLSLQTHLLSKKDQTPKKEEELSQIRDLYEKTCLLVEKCPKFASLTECKLMGKIPYRRYILLGKIQYSGWCTVIHFWQRYSNCGGLIPYSGEVHRYSLLEAGFILPGFSPTHWLTSGYIPEYSGIYPGASINPLSLSFKSRQNASRNQK